MIRLQFLSRCFSSGFIHFQRVINSGKSRGKSAAFLPIRFASITALATVFKIWKIVAVFTVSNVSVPQERECASWVWFQETWHCTSSEKKKIEEHTEKHFFSLKTVPREAVPRKAVELSENICQDPSATVTVAAEI